MRESRHASPHTARSRFMGQRGPYIHTHTQEHIFHVPTCLIFFSLSCLYLFVEFPSATISVLTIMLKHLHLVKTRWTHFILLFGCLHSSTIVIGTGHSRSHYPFFFFPWSLLLLFSLDCLSFLFRLLRLFHLCQFLLSLSRALFITSVWFRVPFPIRVHLVDDDHGWFPRGWVQIMCDINQSTNR